jgi:predicted phosphoribosyltransferase/predicted alpha/beta-hydrolase family hydrolase
MTFADREDAGRRLAQALSDFRDHDVVVLGLPRGGVPVAAVVARALGAPLDVIVVRKLGVPAAPELAMGAIGERGVRVLNELVLRDWNLSERDVERVEARERVELERRVRRFRGERSSLSLAGRTVIVVDDGVATGATARAACLVARELGARRVLLAVPVASSHAVSALEEVADQVVCLREPLWFRAVGEVYEDFAQVSDDEVKSLLDSSPHLAADTRDVGVRTAGSVLPGALVLPQGAGSVVVFAHGSGSSRNSPRNQYVARRLNQAGLGTLLFDLLTSRESEDLALVFDVELLGGRLLGATQWLRAETTLPDGAVGYFGASTGAGAALWAAADPSAGVGAVVSRGGRPDIAAARLPSVTAPTLLIVGGADPVVLDLNRQAKDLMPGDVEIAVVPGAGHLFEEPGALDQVADLAGDWFRRHLVGSAAGVG